jgi:hypothetical protein
MKHAPPIRNSAPLPGRPAGAVAVASKASRAQAHGTAMMLVGLVLTGVLLSGKTPSEVAHFGAVGVGLSIAVSALADLRSGGWKSLIRADLLALMALYFLTLFEFHFPQVNFDALTTVHLARKAVIACIWGFAGLAIGRHIPNLREHPLTEIFTRPVPRAWLLLLFWACLCMGFLHMIIAVDFNFAKMLYYFMTPRFTQPWTRGRLGDWKALLHELEMLLYLIPPLAGIIFARRQNFNFTQLLLTAGGFLFVLFYGFTTGTRNIFATYIVTFLIGYSFARLKPKRYEIAILSGAAALILLGATVFMLQFRQVGFKNYVQGRYIVTGPREKSLFIDYNLFSICQLMAVFPRQHDYLGMEVPYLALIRPIPRALWKEKPEGLSITLEEAVGVEGMTVAASFIGEAFMSGGLLAVFATALFFGYVTGWWSHLASPRNSELGILIYASGFFAAVISMRSMFVFTTALLPTAAAIAVTSLIVKRIRESRGGPRTQRPQVGGHAGRLVRR